MGSINKDFCLWLVSPKDGKVRKLRFSVIRATMFALLVLVFLAGTAFLASDYARLQVLRANESFSLQELQVQRNSLHRTNKNLKLKVRDLSTDNARINEYERSIADRLQRLATVLDSAKALGILQEKTTSVSKSAAKGGVGGMELDCVMGSSQCSAASKWDAATERAVIKVPTDTKGDLLDVLDRYITALRTIPFAYPATGKLTSFFGFRLSPFEGPHVKFHEGIDIGLDYGASVYATADGVIKEIKRTYDYGLYVDIEHTDRVTTRYAHLSTVLVKPGQRVTGSDVIALAGSSGRSTGPHLHYEVRVDGKAKDPRQLFRLGATLRDVLMKKAQG